MSKKIIAFAALSLISQAVIAATTTNVTNNLTTNTIKITAAQSAQRIADEYIVIFHDDTAEVDIEIAQKAINQTSKVLNNKVLHRFSVLKGFAGKIPPGQLKKLQQNPQVKSIEANQTVTLNTMVASTGPAPGSWGIDRLDQQTLPLDNSYSPFLHGLNVHAYVIDTGIRTSHNDFGGRASWDFTASGITDGNDDGNGHGTHIAGTVGSNTYGVASGASLHAVKVFNNAGVGTVSSIIEGIDYVTNNHQSPAVATIGVSTSFSQALNDAVSASTAAGVSYSVPVGDHGQNACNFSPATADGVIAVAASTIDDNASPYSNNGSCVDVYAPGLYITSLWHSSDYANNTISHSPMAAAHAAGVAAIVRSNDSNCDVAQVKAKVLSYAYPDALGNMPAATGNLLLGIPTNLDFTESCDAPPTSPVSFSYDRTAFSSEYETSTVFEMCSGGPTDEWITESYFDGIACFASEAFMKVSSNDDVVIRMAELNIAYDVGIHNVGFNVKLPSTGYVSFTDADGEYFETPLSENYDGFVGIHSEKAIMQLNISGAVDIILNNFISDAMRNNILTTNSAYLLGQQGGSNHLNNIENTPNKDQWASGPLDLGDIVVDSTLPIGVASPNTTEQFPLPVNASVLTSDGPEDEDFTVTLKTPVHTVGFNTHLIEYGRYPTITITLENGTQTVYRPSYGYETGGFFGVSSPVKVQSIRWQAPANHMVGSGISDIVTN